MSMCYHFAILHLFRPFLKLPILGSGFSPEDICHEAADAIQTLLKSFSRLYTLRRAPSTTPFMTLASAVSHLEIKAYVTQLHSPSETDEASVANIDHCVRESVKLDISNLKEMATCHQFALDSISALGYIAKAQGLDIAFEGEIDHEDYDRLVRPYTDAVKMIARKVMR